MKVIIINGMAASGKSTFIKLCGEIDGFVIELSMIDFVKKVARYAGWDGVKSEKGRKFLADIKDAIERYNEDIIYQSIDEKIHYYECCNVQPVFFINARSPEDIDYLKDKYNATTLFITNPRVPNVTTNHADAHVNEYAYDYTIVNDGTMEDLKAKAKEFMEMILK